MNDFVIAHHSAGNGNNSGGRLTSVEELDAMMDRLADTGRATWLELAIPGATNHPYDSTVLLVGLGHEFGSLTFTEAGNEGRRYDSAGRDVPEGTRYDYLGEPTSVPADSAVDLDLARAAAREFLTTGRRPTSVQWTLYDPPFVPLEPMSWDDMEEVDLSDDPSPTGIRAEGND